MLDREEEIEVVTQIGDEIKSMAIEEITKESKLLSNIGYPQHLIVSQPTAKVSDVIEDIKYITEEKEITCIAKILPNNWLAMMCGKSK